MGRSSAISASTALVLGIAARGRPVDPRWWSVVLMLMGAGTILGGPIILALIVGAGARAVSLARRTRPEPVGG